MNKIFLNKRVSLKMQIQEGVDFLLAINERNFYDLIASLSKTKNCLHGFENYEFS